ncbi:MAG: VanZ family protein [Candidatus Omnitrophota bacterium]
MKKSPEVLSSWFLVLVYALFIFAVSAQSRPFAFLGAGRFAPDWVFHMAEYGIFGYFLAKAFQTTFELHSRVLLLVITLVSGTLYGLTDEWHQSFVPSRQASASDLAANAAGVFIGSLLIKFGKKEVHA